jgi:hypothetical protein
MSIKWPDDPSIGNIEADVFDPATWKTEYPNPAFKQMDAADAFWAASIVSRFTDTMIRAVVEEARLTNSHAARSLADVIIKRRDKTVRWGITSTNPLDRFEIRDGRTAELAFDNAAVRLHIVNQQSQYEIRWAPFDNDTIGTLGAIRATVDTFEPRVPIPPDAWGHTDAFGFRYTVAMISTSQPDFPHWRKAVQVTIRNRNGHLDVVGIDRPTDLTAHYKEEK